MLKNASSIFVSSNFAFFALGRRAVFVEILTYLKHLPVNNGKHVALAMHELKLSKHTFGRLF